VVLDGCVSWWSVGDRGQETVGACGFVIHGGGDFEVKEMERHAGEKLGSAGYGSSTGVVMG